jgi:hypothetical protein
MEKNSQWRAASFVLFTKHDYSDQTEEDWMDGECGTHGEKINAYGVFFTENMTTSKT